MSLGFIYLFFSLLPSVVTIAEEEEAFDESGFCFLSSDNKIAFFGGRAPDEPCQKFDGDRRGQCRTARTPNNQNSHPTPVFVARATIVWRFIISILYLLSVASSNKYLTGDNHDRGYPTKPPTCYLKKQCLLPQTNVLIRFNV